MGVASDESLPAYYKPVGITLALASGFFIGSSFIFKKKGLIESQKKHGEMGAGHAYLKSPLWWTGMILMTVGEFANFGAYGFVPAILVTPLGALSVVISTILSSIFLNEKLNFSGKVGCAQCLIGAVIIVLHAPDESTAETIPLFMHYVIQPGFLVYCFLMLFIILYLIYYVSPRFGSTNPIVYIAICSTVGSFLVLSTQGFGTALVYSASHWESDNQFLQWQIYPLLGFVIFTVMTQIHFLNKALNQFSTAIVTPVYYVFFTTMTMLSSAVLFQGFPVQSVISGLSLLAGFFVIIGGVSLLFQYSVKVTRATALQKARANARMPTNDIDDADLEMDGETQIYYSDEDDSYSDSEFAAGWRVNVPGLRAKRLPPMSKARPERSVFANDDNDSDMASYESSELSMAVDEPSAPVRTNPLSQQSPRLAPATGRPPRPHPFFPTSIARSPGPLALPSPASLVKKYMSEIPEQNVGHLDDY